MQLAVVVKPGSRHPGITLENDVLVLCVRERAIEGAANQACIEALAKALKIAPSRIALIRGARSKQKIFAIEGLDSLAAVDRLAREPYSGT